MTNKEESYEFCNPYTVGKMCNLYLKQLQNAE